MESSYVGQPFKQEKFPHLKHLIHTGFYTQPGFYKLRDTLLYANPNFLTREDAEPSSATNLFESEERSISRGEAEQEALEFGEKYLGRNIVVLGHPSRPEEFIKGKFWFKKVL